jgi:hypothetical protein
MIIGNKFAFIHNPHTGGSFIRGALKQAFPEAVFNQLENWHMPVATLDKKHWGKLKWGVVRNPYEWYASFFCHQQPNGFWLKFFGGPNKTFETFLTNMMSLDFIHDRLGSKYHPVGNPYLPPSVTVLDYLNGLDIGFFSYRYVYMFFENYNEILLGNKELFTKHNELISMDHICRNENMVEEIINMFESRNIKIAPSVKQCWKKLPRENSKKKGRYTDYYKGNKKLIQLVEYKDRLLIDKYGYKY